ncbi:MAG: hypothetical protein WKF34_03730 [Pyrinomonadaceae bacterium]
MFVKRRNAPLLFCLSIFAVIGSACSGGAANISNTTSPATPAGAAATNSKPAAAPANNTQIGGEYAATGTNPDGGGNYEAGLTITPREEVYQFSWDSKGKKYDGVGVKTDDAVAVAYTTGTDGEGCGIVLYMINADGSLDGKAGYWGDNKSENERAVRKGGTDLEGDYEISGKSPDGQDYNGTLKIKKEGQGYVFNWDAGNTIEGFGIRAGNLIAVGFGGKQCSFLGYDVQADGSLAGKWGGRGNKTLGTEVAKKK